MMALLIMDMNTVTPCPRHLVSSGCISEEMTHPVVIRERADKAKIHQISAQEESL